MPTGLFHDVLPEKEQTKYKFIKVFVCQIIKTVARSNWKLSFEVE